MGIFKLILFFAVSCILYPASYTHAGTLSPYEIEKLSDKKAPDFTLKDINGNPAAISSFKGKVVLLNFWATWCPPCKEEIPSLNRLQQRLKNKGLVILSISLDKSASTVKNFTAEYPVSFIVLMDHTQKITKSVYKVFTIPTSLLIDKNGVIVEKYFGARNWTKPQMVKRIESLL